MTKPNGAGPFPFGPERCLVGSISDPKGRSSTVGAIIWGMGPGELRLARSLARLGIVAMLLRQSERAFFRLDTEGVRYCKEAIETLRAMRGVERFILMGNCGRASISFHTACDDPRVVGLILSNPALNPVLTVLENYRGKLMSRATWRRLLRGEIHPLSHLRSVKHIKTLLLGRLLGADDKALIAKSGAQFTQDLMLPDNVCARLESLAARGVRVLLMFSEKDPALGYFRKVYGQTFERLNGMSAEVLSTPAHVMTLDDSAAGMFADAICRWAEHARFVARQQPQVDDAPPSSTLSVRYLVPNT